MNRTGTRRHLLLVASTFALITAIAGVADTAQAGDGDGILGYSMRLKNKDFDGSGLGTGDNLNGSVGDTEAKAEPAIETEAYSGQFMSTRPVIFMLWQFSIRPFTFR